MSGPGESLLLAVAGRPRRWPSWPAPVSPSSPHASPLSGADPVMRSFQVEPRAEAPGVTLTCYLLDDSREFQSGAGGPRSSCFPEAAI